MIATPHRFLVLATLLIVGSANFAAFGTSRDTAVTTTLETSRQELIAQLREIWQWPDVLDRPQQISQYSATVVPLVERLAAIEQQTARQDPDHAWGPLGVRDQLLAMALLLGDQKAKGELESSAKSAVPMESTIAKATLLLSKWWGAGRDVDAQSKILDQMEDLLRNSGTGSDRVTRLVLAMRERSASPEIDRRAESIIVSIGPPGPHAKAVIDQWEENHRAQREAQRQDLLNKPITLAGTTLEGVNFSTADWKGHVILVDFWATWCGPCVQSLPEVDQAYTRYHERGLEVVGVCCDWDRDPVAQFRIAHPFMRWPDLFELGHEQHFHPIAEMNAVDGIPTYFLIDKKGVLRKTTSGAGQLPKEFGLVEQLLSEP